MLHKASTFRLGVDSFYGYSLGENMTDFADTSHWNKKDSTTLVYSNTHKGDQHEGKAEMEPNTLTTDSMNSISQLYLAYKRFW